MTSTSDLCPADLGSAGKILEAAAYLLRPSHRVRPSSLALHCLSVGQVPFVCSVVTTSLCRALRGTLGGNGHKVREALRVSRRRDSLDVPERSVLRGAADGSELRTCTTLGPEAEMCGERDVHHFLL